MSLDRPQRIVCSLAPGALLKRLDAPPRPRKADAERDSEYLDFVRQCPCLHCGLDPCYEAAHVRFASGAHGKASGMGKKPADRYALPLCPEHHRLARNCEQLYAQRGDLVAMRAVVIRAISERHASDASTKADQQ